MCVIVKNGVWYCGGDGSGGSGGEITSTFKIESTTLYSGDTTSFPVALSDDINNYDLIKITFGWKGSLDSGTDGACEPHIFFAVSWLSPPCSAACRPPSPRPKRLP